MASLPGRQVPQTRRASMRLLIVDPNETRARALIQGFGLEGVHAAYARDGLSALTLLERELPEYLLVRPPLPDLTVAALTEIVHRDFALDRVRVVLLERADRAGRPSILDRAVVDQVADPALDAAAFLHTLVHRPRAPRRAAPVPGDEGAVAGSFAVLGFDELVQVLAQSEKTGCLDVEAGHEVGKVFFSYGRALHAVAHRWRGERAFERLYLAASRHPAGTFRFHPLDRSEVESLEPTIRRPLQQLLLRVAVALDHERATTSEDSLDRDRRHQG